MLESQQALVRCRVLGEFSRQIVSHDADAALSNDFQGCLVKLVPEFRRAEQAHSPAVERLTGPFRGEVFLRERQVACLDAGFQDFASAVANHDRDDCACAALAHLPDPPQHCGWVFRVFQHVVADYHVEEGAGEKAGQIGCVRLLECQPVGDTSASGRLCRKAEHGFRLVHQSDVKTQFGEAERDGPSPTTQVERLGSSGGPDTARQEIAQVHPGEIETQPPFGRLEIS